MKKIFLGFIAIGLFTLLGCKKNQGNTNSNNTNSSSSGIQYGAGATDIDGNTYQSVIIGNQEWMVENLRTSKYSDGTAIPNVTNHSQWNFLSTAAWCHHDNVSSQYDATYGKLYNWYAVETGKLCPTGWHVPTDAEWTVLTDYLGANGHTGTEGTALKATSGWPDSGSGTDAYGWNGLPGGYSGYNGGGSGCWWSSSEDTTGWAWGRVLSHNEDYLYVDDYHKVFGFSVRCLRD